MFRININIPNAHLIHTEPFSTTIYPPVFTSYAHVDQTPFIMVPVPLVNNEPRSCYNNLRNVAIHGYLCRKEPILSANYPYGPREYVKCDYCNQKDLKTFVHYGHHDLCLTCCDRLK